jgi:PD-(D/E)XK nuclease superfamily
MLSTQTKTNVLTGYHVLRDKLKTRTTGNKLNNFQRLIDGYRPHHYVSTQNQKVTAEEYNVFSVLGLSRLEAKFHTPLIADLLNPTRKHAQLADNYRSFVTNVLQEPEDSRWANVTPFLLDVKAEAHTPATGRIDILIRHNNPDNRFAIIIENKIGARDQEEQVWRYYTYARDMLRLSDDQIRILYLCPEQKPPSNSSLTEDQLSTLTDTGVLKYVSYRRHVTRWIQECRNNTVAPPVAEILSQYLQTLKLICP